MLGYGGSQSLQTPTYFSELVHEVLGEVGIALDKFDSTFYDQAWHEDRELGDAVFFAQEKFGVDRLVTTTDKAADWVPLTPLNPTAQANLIELIDSPPDYLAGRTREEKLKLLSQTSYADFLTKVAATIRN